MLDVLASPNRPPPFSFKSYIETVFGEKMTSLVGVVGRAAASGQALDLHDLMYRFTLDSFGQIGFGVDPGECWVSTPAVLLRAGFCGPRARYLTGPGQ
jgi:hypothetical protein